MNIYLAARYSRRLELCGYRTILEGRGHAVTSRWLNGDHQISDAGEPIGESGSALVECDRGGSGPEAAALRSRFARDDFDDVTAAQLLIAFTEPPRSTSSRGGRHVEFGLALGRNIPIVVIGYRENLFAWLPQVDFFYTWDGFLLSGRLPAVGAR
jgi:hypothetical protein